MRSMELRQGGPILDFSSPFHPKLLFHIAELPTVTIDKSLAQFKSYTGDLYMGLPSPAEPFPMLKYLTLSEGDRHLMHRGSPAIRLIRKTSWARIQPRFHKEYLSCDHGSSKVVIDFHKNLTMK